jgi:hypothetical protein
MKPHKTLMLLCFLSAVAMAQSHISRLQDMVRRSFTTKSAGFMMTTQNGNHVEVCSDICTYFDWRGDPNDERVWRFIALYEVHDTPGTDVTEFARSIRSLKTEDLVEETFCKVRDDDISTLNCKWDAYSVALKIKAGHARYDEGSRCLSQIIDWNKNSTSFEWKCSPVRAEESPFR